MARDLRQRVTVTVRVVHRDVKPINLLLERGLHPRLVDFAMDGLLRAMTTR